MNEEVVERIAASFEKIATALEGLHDEVRRAGTRYWPEPREQKEVVLSRVPTEEDKIRERQGIGANVPIEQWLTELGDPEGEAGIVGERSRQWIIDHPEENQKAKVPDAGAKVADAGKQDDSGAEKVEGQT